MFRALGEPVDGTFALGAKIVRTPFDVVDELLEGDGEAGRERRRKGTKGEAEPGAGRTAMARTRRTAHRPRPLKVGPAWRAPWMQWEVKEWRKGRWQGIAQFNELEDAQALERAWNGGSALGRERALRRGWPAEPDGSYR